MPQAALSMGITAYKQYKQFIIKGFVCCINFFSVFLSRSLAAREDARHHGNKIKITVNLGQHLKGPNN